jgi:hypothetical protein
MRSRLSNSDVAAPEEKEKEFKIQQTKIPRTGHPEVPASKSGPHTSRNFTGLPQPLHENAEEVH